MEYCGQDQTGIKMAKCSQCGKVSDEIAEVLSFCADCIREADEACLTELSRIHARSREQFGLPGQIPSSPGGAQCRLCRNQCRIPIGGRGYCGVRQNENGHITGGASKGAAVSWYFDPLPTNCVADWVCPGGSGAGYPKWAHRPGPEHGHENLAVFYQACTFDCLFCQNWHYRDRSASPRTRRAAELADVVSPATSCICFFGGDPTCQLPHALAVSRLACRKNPGRLLRICWETNGSMDSRLLDEMIELSLESGGCIKFDLKAWDRNIHLALCGVDNTRTLENFAAVAARLTERAEPPLLVASTLLVPGYIDTDEVKEIASYIAELNPGIPYALLGFHGDFLMTDLAPTSRQQAEDCLAAAKAAGLTRVRLGNIHILR